MKNSFALQNIKISDKSLEIEKLLNGYLKNDLWDLNEQFFLKYGGGEKWTNRIKCIDFTPLPLLIRNEVKYWAFIQISNAMLTLNTLATYSVAFRYIGEFIEKYHPNLRSLSEVPLEKGTLQYKTTLIEMGITNLKSNYITCFNSILDFIFNLYDTREEFDKDIWNVKNIPNARYNKSGTHYLIKFDKFKPCFKKLVKLFAKLQISIVSFNTLQRKIIGIKYFFDFLQNEYPDWTDLTKLQRNQIENYLIYYKQNYGHFSQDCNWKHIVAVREFIEYLQRSELSEAPNKPINTLFFKEDLPKLQKLNENQIKYIPETVLNQLETLLSKNPEELNPPLSESDVEYIPIITLLMSTGWRGSDVLNLRYDNCLVITKKGYYLQGDIPKTEVKHHRVPITKEVADVLQAVIEQTKEKSTPENNPNKYLFVRTNGKRKGKPISRIDIQGTLKKWAKRYNIVDIDGKIYHFKNHAFRHTKGVELINNGMNFMHIMKWFAHSSPEMTLHYAKIADDTLRKEWEKAQETKNLLVRVDLNNGNVSEMDLDEDIIHWEYIKSNVEAVRVPLGYCLASKKEGCPFVVTPCLTCPNFCTTPDNLPDFEQEIKRVEEHIEITRNFPIYNEKTKEQLENLIKIRDYLNQGKAHRGDSAKKILFQSEKIKGVQNNGNS